MSMRLLDFPVLIALVSLVLLSLAARGGVALARRHEKLGSAERDDFSVVLGATLTLLGLIIGFTFSMALSRYDERKAQEEGEANALGTAYLRADLLPAPHDAKLRAVLAEYARVRVAHYDKRQYEGAAADALTRQGAALQGRLWATVLAGSRIDPTPLTPLVVSGINDVINAQGLAQAAWWNRIPVSAWILMLAIGVCSTSMLGYTAHNTGRDRRLIYILPLVVSLSFLLIADIDSPRGGLIRVVPENLLSFVASLPPS
jgi:hypothetical protein